MTAEKNKAVKADGDKVRLDLLPPDVLTLAGKGFTYGVRKYSAWNWCQGFEWSRVYAATLRHLTAFHGGEDIDAESGLPHLSFALCSLMMLAGHYLRGIGTDDRHKLTAPACACGDEFILFPGGHAPGCTLAPVFVVAIDPGVEGTVAAVVASVESDGRVNVHSSHTLEPVKAPFDRTITVLDFNPELREDARCGFKSGAGSFGGWGTEAGATARAIARHGEQCSPQEPRACILERAAAELETLGREGAAKLWATRAQEATASAPAPVEGTNARPTALARVYTYRVGKHHPGARRGAWLGHGPAPARVRPAGAPTVESSAWHFLIPRFDASAPAVPFTDAERTRAQEFINAHKVDRTIPITTINIGPRKDPGIGLDWHLPESGLPPVHFQPSPYSDCYYPRTCVDRRPLPKPPEHAREPDTIAAWEDGFREGEKFAAQREYVPLVPYDESRGY